MKSVDKLIKLAERFSHKISLAQSAQKGDVQYNLELARLWGTPESSLFPILDELGIDPKYPVVTNIQVDSSLNVTFPSVITGLPPAKSLALSKALKDKYGQSFSDALKNGFIYSGDTPPKKLGPFRVSGAPLVVGWHKQTQATK